MSEQGIKDYSREVFGEEADLALWNSAVKMWRRTQGRVLDETQRASMRFYSDFLAKRGFQSPTIVSIGG